MVGEQAQQVLNAVQPSPCLFCTHVRGQPAGRGAALDEMRHLLIVTEAIPGVGQCRCRTVLRQQGEQLGVILALEVALADRVNQYQPNSMPLRLQQVCGFDGQEGAVRPPHQRVGTVRLLLGDGLNVGAAQRAQGVIALRLNGLKPEHLAVQPAGKRQQTTDFAVRRVEHEQ